MNSRKALEKLIDLNNNLPSELRKEYIDNLDIICKELSVLDMLMRHLKIKIHDTYLDVYDKYLIELIDIYGVFDLSKETSKIWLDREEGELLKEYLENDK